MSGEQETYPMIKLEKHPKMAACLEKPSPFLGEGSVRAVGSPRSAEAMCGSWEAVVQRLQPQTAGTKPALDAGRGGGWRRWSGERVRLYPWHTGAYPQLELCYPRELPPREHGG